MRVLVNRMVTGTLLFACMFRSEPPPDSAAGGMAVWLQTDHLGDDPAGPFRRSVEEFRDAASAESALERTYQSP